MSESESHADRVTDAIRSAIISRRFAPGDRLSAVSLAEEFKVSQTPLREAFARLAGEGWVVYLPQRGVRVTDVSIKDLVEIFEMREHLEPIAVRMSTQNGDLSWRARVQMAFDAMVSLAADDADPDRAEQDGYELAHSNFHRVLMENCGSAWMIRFTNLLIDQSVRYRRVSSPIRDRQGELHLEHDRLRAAALAGDTEAASDAALVHMRNTKQAVLEWLSQPGNAEVVGFEDLDHVPLQVH